MAAWRASRQSPTSPPCSSTTGHRYAAASTTASMPARRMLASRMLALPAAFAVCRLVPSLGPLASTAGPPAADVATRRAGLAHKSGAIGAAQAVCMPPPHHQACSSARARAPQPAAYWSVSRYLPHRQRPLIKRAPGRNSEWRSAVRKEGSGAATEHRARAQGMPGPTRQQESPAQEENLAVRVGVWPAAAAREAAACRDATASLASSGVISMGHNNNTRLLRRFLCKLF